MFRIIMVFLSSLYLNIFDVNSNYNLVMETRESEEVLNKIDDIILTSNNGFTFKSEQIDVTINKEEINEIINYYCIDDVLYILAKNDSEYYFLMYDTKKNKELYNDKLANYLKLETYFEKRKITSCDFLKEGLVFSGTFDNEDIFIGSKDNIKIFRNDYKEKVCKTIYNENYYYMYIEKDLISEEPFGNGSEKILVKISNSFEIIKINYLENQEYLDFFTENNLLYLRSATYLKSYTLDLIYCTKIDLKASDCVFSGQNGLIIVFSEENNYLLNGLTLLKIGEINKIEEIKREAIKKLSDSFYLYSDSKSIYFDIIDFTKLSFPKDAILDYENTEDIYSFFGKCHLKSRIYDTHFDKAVYGKYNGSIEYETISHLSFILNFVYEIPLKTNIIENGVYKSGFRLLFNGKGTLDGQNIYNNEPVYDVGRHELIIEGNGENKSICFVIDNNQIEFESGLINKGLIFDLNENIVLELKFSNYENYKIKKLNFIHSSCDDYTFEKGILKINYPKEEKPTNKEIFLKSIVFEVYGLEYEYQINGLFFINVIDKKMSERISPIYDINSTKLKYKLNNVKGRMLLIQIINSNNEYNYYYGLFNQDFIINKFDTDSTFKLFLIYDSGKNYYTEYELARGVVSAGEENILKLNINAYEENVKEFTVNFKEDAAKFVKVDNKIIYTSDNVNIEKIIILSAFSLFISFGLGKLLQIIFRRKRKTI